MIILVYFLKGYKMKLLFYLLTLIYIMFFIGCSQPKLPTQKAVINENFELFKFEVNKLNQKQLDYLINSMELYQKDGSNVDTKYLLYILEKGANPNSINTLSSHSMRPSNQAVNYYTENLEAMKLLLQYGMDPFLPPNKYVKSLFYFVDGQLTDRSKMRELIFSYKEDFLEFHECKKIDSLECYQRILLINPNTKYKNVISSIYYKKNIEEQKYVNKLIKEDNLKDLKKYISNHLNAILHIKDKKLRLNYIGPKNLMVIDLQAGIIGGIDKKKLIAKISNIEGGYKLFDEQEKLMLKEIGFSSSLVKSMEKKTKLLYLEEEEKIKKLRKLRSQKNDYDPTVDVYGEKLKASDAVQRSILKYLIKGIDKIVNPEKFILE